MMVAAVMVVVAVVVVVMMQRPESIGIELVSDGDVVMLMFC